MKFVCSVHRYAGRRSPDRNRRRHRASCAVNYREIIASSVRHVDRVRRGIHRDCRGSECITICDRGGDEVRGAINHADVVAAIIRRYWDQRARVSVLNHCTYWQRPCAHIPLQHCADELHCALWKAQHRWAKQILLQHWRRELHACPRGWQDDCAATGRALKLIKPTVSITNTARFLKILKRDIAFLLLILWILTRCDHNN